MDRGRRDRREMWKVVYIAPDRAGAEAVQAALAKEGLLVVLRPVEVTHAGRYPVEVLVPRSEAAEATRILQSSLGGKL